MQYFFYGYYYFYYYDYYYYDNYNNDNDDDDDDINNNNNNDDNNSNDHYNHNNHSNNNNDDNNNNKHILDLTNNQEAGPALVTSLTTFINMLLAGRCPHTVIPVFFSGSLIALEKKSGGIRPIAIGYILRRLAAKCANTHALHTIGAKLLPEQLGLGTSGGCEAAVHATRRFLANMPPDYLLVKLDFSNAFNNIHRDAMLSAAAEHVPSIYQFCLSSYEKTTLLKFSSHIILSQ